MIRLRAGDRRVGAARARGADPGTAAAQGRGDGAREARPFFDTRASTTAGDAAAQRQGPRRAARPARPLRRARRRPADRHAARAAQDRRRAHRPQQWQPRRHRALLPARQRDARSGCRVPTSPPSTLAKRIDAPRRRDDPALPAGLPRDPGVRQRRARRARPRRPRARRHRLAAGRRWRSPRSRRRLVRGRGAARAPAQRRRGARGARGERPAGARRTTRFAGGEQARLTLFGAAGGPRLAWRVDDKASSSEHYDGVVDADQRPPAVARQPRQGRTRRASSTTTRARPRAATRHRGQDLTAPGWLPATAHRTSSGPFSHAWSDVDDDNVADAGRGGHARRAATSSSRSPRSPTTGRRAARRPHLCSWDPVGDRSSWETTASSTTTQAFYLVSKFHDHLAPRRSASTRRRRVRDHRPGADAVARRRRHRG